MTTEPHLLSHKEVFNKAASGILAAIYDRHPISYSFAVQHAFQGLSDLELPIYLASIQWLVDEGFLRCNRESTCPGKDFLEMRLSLQGLNALNQTLPGLLKELHGTIGELLINEVKKGAEGGAEALLKHALACHTMQPTGENRVGTIPVGSASSQVASTPITHSINSEKRTVQSCIAIARRVQGARYLAEDKNGSDAARQVADFIEEELLNTRRNPK